MTKNLLFMFVIVVLVGFLPVGMETPAWAQETVEDIEEFSLEELLNVEITTAGKQAEKIGEIPASVIVVTREDIEKYGYQTLAEILENIPGLYQIDDWNSKNFGVRGFTTEAPLRNVIVLVNDIEQTDGLTSGNWLNQINIPPEAIDRIEVVRGPISVLYGTGAFFGAINIKTNIVEEKEPASFVSASYGTENTLRTTVRASGKKEDFQYAFTGSYFNTDGLDIPYEKIGDSAVLESWGISPGKTTKKQLENQEKFFNFSGTFKEFTFNASYTEANRESMPILPSVTEGTSILFNALRVFSEWKKEFSDKATLDAKFTYFRNRRAFNYDWLFRGFFGIQDDQAYGYDAEIDLFLNPTPKLNILLGASYRNILDVSNTSSVPFFGINLWNIHLADGESIVTQAGFMQFNWKLSNKFKIVAGARLEQVPEYKMEFKVGDSVNGTYTARQTTYSFTKAEFIPRAALIFSPNDKNVIKFLYGRAINRPSFFQMAEEIYYQPNIPKPEPETIDTFELNYLGTLSPTLSLNLSVFHNSMDNLIFRSIFLVEGSYVSYYSNVGKMTTTGAELTITAKPFKNFLLELSGVYQDTKDKRPGYEDIDVAYSPKLLGYIKASLLLNKDISIAVTGNYVDEMESYYDDTVTPPARLGEKVDAYFLLGANLRIRNLFGTGMFLNIRGSNLLDQKYHFPSDSNNNLFATYGTLGRGMSILATLGYRFIPMPRP